MSHISVDLSTLQIKGDVLCDSLHKTIYSTDASAYIERPIGVAYPRDREDIQTIVRFAINNNISLIPRAAGTSLAGQVVGDGLVVDISRYMNQILEINPEERWIRVQPGVVLDEVNLFCKPYGLFFAPETSTSNRCCVGGMVGNNSCGSHSLVYGSTREHLLKAEVVLSDSSVVVFEDLDNTEVEAKLAKRTLEGDIYNGILSILLDKDNQREIRDNFPDKTLTRRNSGYALDELLNNNFFDSNNVSKFNLCKVLAGSEGTLAFATELTLNLEPLPPAHKCVICVHFETLKESFEANLVALKHKPVAIELIDGKILELSKQNIAQNKNRFFIEGDPKAVLIIELAEESKDDINTKATNIISDLKNNRMGYHYPILYGADINRVWALRKAGLGLLSGMVGDAKPVSVVEDTAVAPERLPAYMADFAQMMSKWDLSCVYHAHISTGELHLRPIINLKEDSGKTLFRIVAKECAQLVKKHRGSLSGEHGDGRLRGEFLPILFGDKVYTLFKEFKSVWDKDNIFNRGKIVETPAMDSNLRYVKSNLNIKTYFDYSRQGGFVRAVEQCNGSGDCRKSELFAGTMCPTFRATKDETNVTRARANGLREALLSGDIKNIFNNKDTLKLLDNCVSCKACKSECPSNVDMTRYKAEYMQHYYDKKRVPLRTLLIANIDRINAAMIHVSAIYNSIVKNRFFARIIKGSIGFTQHRPLPTLSKQSLRDWYKRSNTEIKNAKATVYLFADEFTNYMDAEIGISFIKLLNKLGYNVIIPNHVDSGRAQMSKGLLKRARLRANANVELLHNIVDNNSPLVGIEPSTILSFRDEYPDLVDDRLKERALALSKNVLLYDEFIVREIEKGNINQEQFTDEVMKIKLHGHCHQKSLASVEPSKVMLSLPKNYQVEIIPSGCCGMAGSFGHEKEHYELSMQIGETTLFPEIRKTDSEYIISAPGTSCREQIFYGTARRAYHPIEILYKATI
ncbi:MAG: FAD-binding protein [bacterium]